MYIIVIYTTIHCCFVCLFVVLNREDVTSILNSQKEIERRRSSHLQLIIQSHST